MCNMKNKQNIKKIILRIWIAIAVLLFVIAGVFLFSEKVYKIGIVDDVKNIFTGQIAETVSNDLNKPQPPTDTDVQDFYNNNIAIIVRCVDNSRHNGSLSRIAIGSYEIGEVESY